MALEKILAICLIAAVLAVVLSQYKGEYAMAVSVTAALIVFFMILESISSPLARIGELLNSSGIEPVYFKIAAKALGIGYLTGFIAEACRDFGQSALATKAELAGKCAIFILSVPMLTSILEIALGFIK